MQVAVNETTQEQTTVIAQNRGYWGYEEIEPMQQRKIAGAGDGDGDGDGDGCGGCGDSDSSNDSDDSNDDNDVSKDPAMMATNQIAMAPTPIGMCPAPAATISIEFATAIATQLAGLPGRSPMAAGIQALGIGMANVPSSVPTGPVNNTQEINWF